jgi:hypothetical protein
MRAKQHAIFRAALRHRPQRGHAARIGLDVVHATWLRRDVAQMLEHRAHLVERHVRVGTEPRPSILV